LPYADRSSVGECSTMREGESPIPMKFAIIFVCFAFATCLIAEQNTEANVTGLGECGTYNLIKQVGFPSSAWNVMTCIASLESSYNCAAGPHENSNGTDDYGLFQINSGYWCSGPGTIANGCGHPCSDMFQCQTNAQCALEVYHQQGFTAWATYNNNREYCESFTVNC